MSKEDKNEILIELTTKITYAFEQHIVLFKRPIEDNINMFQNYPYIIHLLSSIVGGFYEGKAKIDLINQRLRQMINSINLSDIQQCCKDNISELKYLIEILDNQYNTAKRTRSVFEEYNFGNFLSEEKAFIKAIHNLIDLCNLLIKQHEKLQVNLKMFSEIDIV